MLEGDARRALAHEIGDLCSPSHRVDLEGRLQKLSDKEMMILLKRIREESLEQIARELGVSSSRVSQLAKRAITKFCEEPKKGARHDG